MLIHGGHDGHQTLDDLWIFHAGTRTWTRMDRFPRRGSSSQDQNKEDGGEAGEGEEGKEMESFVCDGEAPPPSAYHHALVVPRVGERDKYSVSTPLTEGGITGEVVSQIVYLGVEEVIDMEDDEVEVEAEKVEKTEKGKGKKGKGKKKEVVVEEEEIVIEEKEEIMIQTERLRHLYVLTIAVGEPDGEGGESGGGGGGGDGESGEEGDANLKRKKILNGFTWTWSKIELGRIFFFFFFFFFFTSTLYTQLTS